MYNSKVNLEWVKNLTIKSHGLWLWIGLFLLTLVRLTVAAFIPLSPDEAYYWLWSNYLDYSFYDHPPMVALWIKIGCLIGGKTAFGVRFLASFAAFFGSIFIYFGTLDFSSSTVDKKKNAIIAILFLNTTLAISIGCVTITPDTPLLFFICVFIWGCGRLIVTQNSRWWLIIGAAAGFALLSKYTTLLIIISLGIWCLSTKTGRSYFKSKDLWLGFFLMMIIFSPVIYWNANHQWISFLKQGGRTIDWNPNRALQFVLELIGGQIGLATPLIFLCFVRAFINLTRIVWKKRQEEALLLWFLIIIPLCVFIQHALGDRVQANWVGIVYPVLSIITAIYLHYWIKSACILGNVIVGFIYIQTLFFCFPVPAKQDLILKRLGGWEKLAQTVSDQIPPSAPVIIDSYGLASEFAFYGNKHPIILVDRRWKYFNLPEYYGKTGYLIRSQRRKDNPPHIYFLNFENEGMLIRKKHQKIAEIYNIYKVKINYTKDNKHEIVYLP